MNRKAKDSWKILQSPGFDGMSCSVLMQGAWSKEAENLFLSNLQHYPFTLAMSVPRAKCSSNWNCVSMAQDLEQISLDLVWFGAA